MKRRFIFTSANGKKLTLEFDTTDGIAEFETFGEFDDCDEEQLFKWLLGCFEIVKPELSAAVLLTMAKSGFAYVTLGVARAQLQGTNEP